MTIKIRVDMAKWLVRDQIDLEGNGFTVRQMREAIDSGEVPTKLAMTLVWLFRRKTEPFFSWENALDIPWAELEGMEIEVVEDATDPKAPPAKGSRGSASGQAGRHKK